MLCCGYQKHVCITQYEQANSIKNACFQTSRQHSGAADSPSWLLHFTRKFNLAIQSRFPDSRIIAPSPLLIRWSCSFPLKHSGIINTASYNGIMRGRSSVTVTGSLRILTWFPFLPDAQNRQHSVRFIWNYTRVSIAFRHTFVNDKIFEFPQPVEWP